MQEPTLWQNLLTFLALGLIGLFFFWWWGGFIIIGWIRKKRLAKRAANPIRRTRVENPDEAWMRQFATAQNFQAYAVAQNIKSGDTWPEQMLERFPDSHVAVYFAAAKLLELAWEARGTGYVANIPKENIALMFENLDKADRLIDSVISHARVPADFLLLQLDADMLRSRHKHAQDLVTEYRHALNNRLDVYFMELHALYPRWGGSHEQLQARAREIGARGGLHCAAEAFAWCHLAEDESPANLRKTLQGQQLDDLIARYEKLPKTPAVINDYSDYMTLLAHKTFAALFVHLNRKSLATRALRAMSRHYDGQDWVNHYEQDLSYLDAALKFKAY